MGRESEENIDYQGLCVCVCVENEGKENYAKNVQLVNGSRQHGAHTFTHTHIHKGDTRTALQLYTSSYSHTHTHMYGGERRTHP